MTFSGWRLRIYDVLPSTSDLCRALADAGEEEGLAVLARRQSAGRGSRGRGWVSEPGQLALSVLLRPATPARLLGQWSLLAGVALAEALAPLLPDPACLMLKWPNDVLVSGRKLAGILIDADPAGGWLVVGLGANLTHAPVLAERETAAIGPTSPPPEQVAAEVLDRLAHWYGVVEAEGFAGVRAAFLARAPRQGSGMTLRLPHARLAGRFAGIDEQGGLLLEADGAVRSFAVGEVLLGDAPHLAEG